MSLIRVRTKAGVWRIKNVDLSVKMSDFIQRLESEQKIGIKKVSLKPNLSDTISEQQTLKQIGLKNGSMIYV